MTITLKSTEINDSYITVEAVPEYNSIVYRVQVCTIIDENICGYPEKELYYPTEEKAVKSYNRIIKKYKGV